MTTPTGKHSHYSRDVYHLDSVDIYRVIELFGVQHAALQHALKKVMAAGQRGAKNEAQDVQEAIDSLTRWQAMRKEDARTGAPPVSPRYGCHNRAPYIPVIELHDHHGALVSSWPHVMAKDCQFTHSDLGAVDKRCDGCKHKASEGVTC